MNKNRIVLGIIFSIFIVLTISTYYNTQQQKEYINIKHQQSFETLQYMIDGKIIFYRKLFSNRLQNMMKNSEEFKDAVVNNDKKSIYKHMDKFFKILKKENKFTKTLHLVSKDNISIYRAHKPQKRGDDLTYLRPIVKSVNELQKAKYGFEAGLYAMVYRLNLPINYDGKHYGVIEYGIDSSIFVEDLSSVSNYMESAILISQKTYKLLSKHNNKLSSEIVNKNDKFILFDNDDFFKNINIEKVLNNQKLNVNQNYYTTFLYDLLSFDGSVTGKILIAINVTPDEARYNQIIEISLINQIILMLIIFTIVYYAFQYYDKKIKKLTELEKQNERIVHQQSKMASMGEMIGNIAHQWRQPLSTISTIASGINVQKDYGIFDESTLTDSMNKVIDQTEYMSKTIEDFKDFFKSDKEKISFELNTVLEQNITLMESSLKSNNINLEFNNADNITLHGYQNELTQAILNIISNAKDQLKKLGSEEFRIIKIETKQTNDGVFINIIDNGGGVDENIQNKIFEPYFTTKHQSQGTGIGLYMTHEIIVKHFNGTIKVSNKTMEFDNKKYKCAVFSIVLP